MIKLSRITDYGIVLMANFATLERGVSQNAREASAETGLPLPMVSKVLKALARESLLISQRGAKGGYTLARPPAEISVVEMVTALEGPIGLTECTTHPGACAQEASCEVRAPWQLINLTVRDALANISLDDLTTRATTHTTGGLDIIPLTSPR